MNNLITNNSNFTQYMINGGFHQVFKSITKEKMLEEKPEFILLVGKQDR